MVRMVRITGETECCLSKIENLAVPARVALLQGTMFGLVTLSVSTSHK